MRRKDHAKPKEGRKEEKRRRVSGKLCQTVLQKGKYSVSYW